MKSVRLLIASFLCVVVCLDKSDAQVVEIIRTFAGTGATGPFADGGAATAGTMNNQYLINLDPSGANLYIADNGDNRVRKVNIATGIITTVAGTGTGGSLGDGAAATAAQLGASGGGLPGVVGVCADGSGNVFIADGSNQKIRKVDATGIITTIGGTGTAGFTGDGGPATLAQIRNPRGIWVDASGNIYFTDGSSGGGGSTTRVRKIDGAGIITSIAGNGTAGYTGDGVVATTTNLNNPRGLCVDASGNVYVADFGNNRIRRIDGSTNIITTVAGTGTGGYSGEGLAATASRLSTPLDVKMDAAGNLYIADNANSRVRKVDMSTGIMNTVAGSGTAGSDAGNWGPATAAAVRLASLSSIAVAPNANWFYISDRQGGGGSAGNRIKLVRPNSIPYFNGGATLPLVVCENATATSINALVAITDSDLVQTETWTVAAPPTSGILAGFPATATANGATVTPAGLTYTPNPGFSGTDAFTIQISDGYNTATAIVNVTVNPLPVVAVITGVPTVCVGGTTVLADATSGGVWAASNTNATVLSGTVSGVTAGTVDISYTVTNSCGPTSVVQTVTVNPLPVAGTITGSLTVCVGANTVLTDATGGGTWSALNGNATVVGGTVTGVATGTDDISYSVTNVCGTSNAIVTVTINAAPSVPPIAGAGTVCEGANIILTDATPGGLWSASNSNATVAGGTVTGVTAGTDDISYAVANGCGTTTVTKTITINPAPVSGTISGSPNVCIAGTVTLSVTGSGGTWTASNANATVTSTGDVTGVAVGTDVISYSVTNGCGTSVATFTINVISTPSAGTISGPTNVCPGVSIPLSDGVLGGIWMASNANATITGGGVVTGVTAGIDTISYTVTVSCGTATATYVVTVNPLADPGTITGASSVCIGSVISLTDPASGGSWSSSSSFVATVTSSGLVTGVASGLATISYSVTNICGTLSAIKNITVNANVLPTVTFTASPGFTTCPGTLVTYSANPINGGLTPTYEWKVNGFVLGGGAAFNHTPVNHDTIVCKMTSSLACVIAPSDADTVIVVVNPTLSPVVNVSTGVVGDTVCIGTLTTYTATPTNGGSAPSYQWYVNGTPVAGSNVYTYIPANGDVITCALTSNYPCPLPATVMSNSVTMTVDITEVPAVTITVSPIAAVCVGSPVTFTAHPLYGGIPPAFTWTKNGINVATGPNYILTPANGDNVFCTMTSSATCATVPTVTSNHIHLTVENPVPITVTITHSSPVISVGGNDVFTAVVVTAALTPTYQWYVNGVSIPGANSSTFVVTGTTAGTKTVNCVVGSGDACYTTGTSNVVVVNVTNVGIKPLSSVANELKLSPNPNSGKFAMNMISGYDEPAQVIVTNILGEKVKEFTTTTNKDIEIDLDRAHGIYFLSAFTEHGKFVAKVIVE